MAVSNNKKFYYMIQILFKYSDENNILSFEEINSYLSNGYGYTIERKALYRYIKDLKEMGIDISDYKENKEGYYIREQRLEEYEIRILLDCIAASKAITTKKTKELSSKLCKMNNIYVGYDLNRQVHISNRTKSLNEEIFINIDAINRAIKEEKKISFHYCDYNIKKELVMKKDNDGNNKEFIVNPIAMVLKDDYYYLILNKDNRDDLSNYRIDRIKRIKILEEDRKPLNKIKKCGTEFDPATYAKKCIKMFFGDEKRVELEIEKYILGYILDELGNEVIIRDIGNGKYNVSFECICGSGLVKWILQLGSSVKVIKPLDLRENVLEEIDKTMSLYR